MENGSVSTMLSLHRHSQTERRRVYTENTLHHKLICCIHTVWVLGESDHARLIQRKSNPTVSLFCPSTLTSSTRGKRKSERDKNHTTHNKRKESKQRGGGGTQLIQVGKMEGVVTVCQTSWNSIGTWYSNLSMLISYLEIYYYVNSILISNVFF